MGSYTTGSLFYKPAYGASGTSEKALYDSALDTAAVLILAASATASTGLSIANTGSSTASAALTTATAAVPKSLGTTKGHMITFTTSATPAAVAVSTVDGQVLTISTAAAGNVVWSEPAVRAYSATIAASGIVTASGDYTAAHTLGQQYVFVVVADNTNGAVTPSSIVYTNTSTCVVNITGELATGTLAGAYQIYIVG